MRHLREDSFDGLSDDSVIACSGTAAYLSEIATKVAPTGRLTQDGR